MNDPVLPRVEAAVERINEGDREGGKTLLQGILLEHPFHRHTLESLAKAHLQDGEKDQAARFTDMCLEKHKDSSKCWTVRGQLLFDSGDSKGAEKALKRAITANEGDPEAHLSLGVVRMQMNELERAEVNLNHALVYRRRGTLGNVFLHLAGLYERMKRPVNAAQQLMWFLRENPNAPNAAEIRERLEQFKHTGDQ